MADKSIGELIAATQITESDLFVLEQSGTAKKLTGQIFVTWLTHYADGHGGIQSLEKTSTTGTNPVVDTYTITYADATTSQFTVTNGKKGDTGARTYVWIRYSESMPTADSDMSTSPDNYIGIYVGLSATAPAHYTDYVWSRFKGETGDAATLETPTITYQEGDYYDTVPQGTWHNSPPAVAAGKYLWTKVVLNFNTGDPVTYYSVARYGVDGEGSPGSSLPIMDGIASVGTANAYSREDHVHPVRKPYSDIFNQAQIIGHRANSIATLNEFLRKGIRFVEADIRITSDNVGILSHDNTFQVGGTTYTISTMTYSAIVNTGASFDTLDSLLNNCKRNNVALYLDIKNGTTTNITSIYELVRDWGMLDKTVFGTISANAQVVSVLTSLNKNLIFDYVGGNNSTVDAAISALNPCGLIFMHYDVGSSLPTQTIKNAVEYAHTKGVKSYVWTVDSSSVSDAYFNIGIDQVMSNTLDDAKDGWSRIVKKTYSFDNVVIGANTSLIFRQDISATGLTLLGLTSARIEDGSGFTPGTDAGSGWSYMISQGADFETNECVVRIGNLNTTKPLKLQVIVTALYGTNA